VPWYSISAPAAVPDAVLRRINDVADKSLKAPELKERWQTLGLTPVGGSPEDAVRRNELETRRWSRVIKAAAIKVQ
jgi:tripartite-type tricarboxylate transporter receptor subunit TctC